MAFEVRVLLPPDVDEPLVPRSLLRVELRLETVDLGVGAACALIVIRLPVADVCVARAAQQSAISILAFCRVRT